MYICWEGMLAIHREMDSDIADIVAYEMDADWLLTNQSIPISSLPFR